MTHPGQGAVERKKSVIHICAAPRDKRGFVESGLKLHDEIAFLFHEYPPSKARPLQALQPDKDKAPREATHDTSRAGKKLNFKMLRL